MKTQNSDTAYDRQVIIYCILVILVSVGIIFFSVTRELKPTQQKAPVLAEDETVETAEAPPIPADENTETTPKPTVKSTETTLETVETEETVTKTTLYDTLTLHEITLLEVTIQHEVGNFSKEYKTYVAELIYNRLVSEDFPDTIHDVLFQEGQFQGIAVWSNSGIIPDEETKAVVNEVFSSENPSHNCTYYYNPALSDYEAVMWFECSGDVEYVFSHTETSWGIEYETRFLR